MTTKHAKDQRVFRVFSAVWWSNPFCVATSDSLVTFDNLTRRPPINEPPHEPLEKTDLSP
jgi:hypothetical protein